jgi:asparagine synthase (glutamine-hydrolysing)
VIAGVLERGPGTGRDPAAALGGDAQARRAGALHVAWRDPASAREADGLLVVLDGFLLGEVAELDQVAAGWRRSGAAMAESLRGAFTLLAWDEAAQEGMIACDQFSLRVCLIHGSSDGPLSFSTHLPALRAMLPRDPEPEPGVIVPWIAPHYLQGHGTMLRGVERVGAARLLELDVAGWRRRRYWQPAWRGTIDASEDELVDRLRSELRRAISERLSDGAPAGTILSGGVDSSVVLATAAGLEPRAGLRAYSTVFPDWPAADESRRIAATTDALGVPSARFALRPQGALRLALEQLRSSGTVPGGPGGLVERPGVSEAASDGVEVLLDGQGGDEVFGRSPYVMADSLRRADLAGAARAVRAMVPHRGRRRRQKLGDAARLLLEFGVRPALARPQRRDVAADWLTSSSAGVLDEVHDPWPWLGDRSVPRWWAYHAYLLSDHVEGSGLGEHIWERGVPFGLRSGAPLFDVDLVEFVLRIPPRVSWRHRMDRYLARATVAGRLPDVVRLNRVKANIGPFYLDLLTGPDSAIIRELLLDPRARVREFADAAWIERNVPRSPSRTDSDWLTWTTVVWRLATAECCLRWLEDRDFPDQLLARTDLPEPSWAPV